MWPPASLWSLCAFTGSRETLGTHLAWGFPARRSGFGLVALPMPISVRRSRTNFFSFFVALLYSSLERFVSLRLGGHIDSAFHKTSIPPT